MVSIYFLANPRIAPELSPSSGVLAVTRSLGDSSMKEFVVGAPYTTETTLDDDDEFLIVACDGVGRKATSTACETDISVRSFGM
jgi:serine/threonine protein phosphatase PrpC